MSDTLQAPEVWTGLYDEGWRGVIVDESFRHPAKYSRGLIRRIYRELIENHWLYPGQTVCDPFGGVGLGALDAMQHGLKWVGCELERDFCALANKNLALWASYGVTGGRIVQGDSRKLREHVGVADAVCSSPPFCDGGMGDSRPFGGIAERKPHWNETTGAGGCSDYGTTPGNLGNMKPGEVDSIIHTQENLRWLHAQTADAVSLEKTTPADAVPATAKASHGCFVAESCLDSTSKKSQPQSAGGGSPTNTSTNSTSHNSQLPKPSPPQHTALSGESAGGVSGLPSLNVTESACSAEPQPDCTSTTSVTQKLPAASGTTAQTTSKPSATDATHGNTSGGSNNAESAANSSRPRQSTRRLSAPKSAEESGGSDKQKTEETFWQASAQILRECYLILKSGGVAVFVVKNFVRNGKIVPFCNQWRQLAEHVGFQHVKTVHASLVKRDEHPGLFGEAVVKQKKRVSFFRRLHEKKRPDLAIDYEVVLFVRKP